MKAISVSQFGGPEVLTLVDLPDPVAGPGQVRVRVGAAGVNPFDTYMRAGGYAINPPLPYTPGADAAGVVDQVSDGVTGVAVGDRVYTGGTAQNPGYGAYASLILCTPQQVHPLPGRVSFAQGAGVNVPCVTAWMALFGRGEARPGETVFIHGASGGVGLAATQLARAAGLTVIGSAGTDEGLGLVGTHGAHHVLRHGTDDYLTELSALTGGRGPDLIVEMLANANLDRDLGAIARRGRIVVVGNRGRGEIDARQIMGKDCTIRGFALWTVPPDEILRAHRAIGAALENGTLQPVVGRELPLADAAAAHTLIREPGARGNIVLIP